jgi:glycine/D-amino acid oxidase-like deaminating enzyme
MTAVADVPARNPTWYEATAAAKRDRARLTFDLDVDVCVIGGGLAGLTVARELARRNWSVAVLEARQIGWSASGRNCGFVLPGFAETMSRIAERVGPDQARAMWDLADAGRAYVRDTIADTGMPGVAPVDGWLRVAKFAEDGQLSRYADDLRERFGATVDVWPSERVRAALRSPLYFNALHFPTAFHIHPLNYLQGLAAAAEQSGARIFEDTPALELDPHGVRKRVVTPSGRVRAGRVVLAGNIYLKPLQRRLAGTLMPVTTFIAVTAPLGAQLRETIGYSGAVSDSERADNHYRIVEGDRLLWSGGVRTWSSAPHRFRQRLSSDMARVYPQLAGAELDYVWSGTLGRTVHRMPQIGELTPGLWVASGFGGHGLNTTAMAGMLIARAIIDSDTAWRVFEAYELVWAGGLAGRAVVQIGYAATRLRERSSATPRRGGESESAASSATPGPAAAQPADEATETEAPRKRAPGGRGRRRAGKVPAAPPDG